MTDINITFNTLDSYFLNTATGKINEGYLNETIYIIFDIDYRHTNGGNGKSKLYYILTNKRRKNPSLIWEAFLLWTNQAIENDYYNKPYKATSEQLKKWLEKYHLNYSVFDPLSEEINALREDINK